MSDLQKTCLVAPLLTLLLVACAGGDSPESTKIVSTEPDASGNREVWILGGTIGLDLPADWEIDDRNKSESVFIINNKLKASIMIAPQRGPIVAAKYLVPGFTRDEILKSTLETNLAPPFLQVAGEEKLDIQPLPGSEPPGYYFALPGPEGRVHIGGLTYLAKMELTMLCSTASRADVDEVLAIVGSVRAKS